MKKITLTLSNNEKTEVDFSEKLSIQKVAGGKTKILFLSGKSIVVEEAFEYITAELHSYSHLNADKSGLERNYVLLSVKWTRENLVFWGRLSKDEELRSYGGYTDDFSSCERYTLGELKEEGGFHDYFNEPLSTLKKTDSEGTWIVHVDDLNNIGRVVTRYAVR